MPRTKTGTPTAGVTAPPPTAAPVSGASTDGPQARLVFLFWRFPEDAPELQANFLTASAKAGSYVPSNLLWGLRSFRQISDHWNAPMLAFLWSLDRSKGYLFSCGFSALGRTAGFPVSMVLRNY